MEATPLVSTQPPTADGERRVYLSPELKDRSILPASIRKVIYVNGMSTTPETHRDTCWLLSEITESHVLGVYNLTGSTGLPQGAFFTDLLQCLIDKASVLGLVAQKLSAKATGLPASERRVYMKRCLSLNLATQSLFEQLLLELGTGRPVVIVCHSQGNLITGNALNALSWVQGGPLPFINVFCLASPALYWPGGTSSQFFTNTDDLIPVGSFGLNLLRDKDWSESGANPNAPWVAPDLFMDAHNIRRYLDKPDFVAAIRKVLGPTGPLPPAPQAPPGAPPGRPQRYVIKPGDTLSRIARQLYGNPGLASRIHAANQATIGNNPNLLLPGRELVIP